MIDVLRQLLADYPVLAPVIFVFARTIPIIIAPVPGVVVDLIGIAAFGSLYGFVLGETGILIASAVTFLIARHFREPLVKRFASVQKIHQWESRFSQRRKFLGLVAIRTLTSPAFDYVGYAMGLTKMPFSKYMLATLIGTFPLIASIYFFGGYSLQRGLFTTFIFLALLVLIMSTWGHLLKKHLEKDALFSSKK